MQVGVNEDGTPIMGNSTSVTILIFKDENGVDIIDVAKSYPHAFYIAIDDYGHVVSMTDDIEKSQIAEFQIIGIDSDFGFTSGPGGTVYGKLWNGSEIVEPQPEPVVVIIPAVTLWERMTENEAEQVNGVMATQPFRTRKIFETANTFRSDHELWPLLEQIATQLFGLERGSELLAPPL